MKLSGKTVLVTGGSKGIGRAVVEAMAEQGANIIINYNNDEKAANGVADLVKKQGTKVLVVKADIAKPDEVKTMFSKIKAEFGSIDVLVNNAGLFDENDSPDSIEAFENVFKTNLFAQIEVTNAARKLMTRARLSLFHQYTASLDMDDQTL